MGERRFAWNNITLVDKDQIKRAIAQARWDARIADAIANRKKNETIPQAAARGRHSRHEETRSLVQIKHDVLVQKLQWWARDPWGSVDDDLFMRLLREERSSKSWEKNIPIYITATTQVHKKR